MVKVNATTAGEASFYLGKFMTSACLASNFFMACLGQPFEDDSTATCLVLPLMASKIRMGDAVELVGKVELRGPERVVVATGYVHHMNENRLETLD